MSFDIDGPEFPQGCAVVFGGSGGIGQAIAGLLAARGSDVVLTYHSRIKNTQSVADEIRALGRSCTVIQCDLSDPKIVAGVFKSAVAAHGRVHTIVAATGLLFDVGPLTDFTPEAFRAVIETDVIGFFNIAQAGVPLLRAGGGSITALVTPAIHKMVPTDALSSTPKAAVAMLIRHIAAEEGPNGVRANAVGPGVIAAGMTIPMRKGPAKALFDLASSFTPLRRDGRPEEVAQLVAFLTSAVRRSLPARSFIAMADCPPDQSKHPAVRLR